MENNDPNPDSARLRRLVDALRKLYKADTMLRLRVAQVGSKVKAFSDWDAHTSAMRDAQEALRAEPGEQSGAENHSRDKQFAPAHGSETEPQRVLLVAAVDLIRSVPPWQRDRQRVEIWRSKVDRLREAVAALSQNIPS